MKIVGIIQARMGSSRLPGKMIEDIQGKPLIEHLFDRVKQSETLDSIVLATTEGIEDDVIVDIANKNGLEIFRGSKDDVLDRYLKASEKYDADVVVRICGDNPLTDPIEIDKIVRHHIKTNADYSYNNRPHPKSLPDGAGAEVISIDTLKKIHNLATRKDHREHVTLYIHDNPSGFKIELLDADPELVRPNFRLDVDYDEDLQFIRDIYSRLYKQGNIIKLNEVIGLLDKQPALLELRKKR